MVLHTIGVWIAALLTLAIYSFLYKDNPFYKLAENIFVGVSAGYWAVILWHDFARPNLFAPLFQGRLIYLIPIIMGLLMFTTFFPKITWLVRIPLTFTMGVAMSVTILQYMQGDIIPQLQATILPLRGVPILTAFSNILIIVGVLSTLVYFYFSHEHKGALGLIAKIGIWFMMVSFGASFGYTIMARVSLLIGRMYFLLHNWLGIIP